VASRHDPLCDTNPTLETVHQAEREGPAARTDHTSKVTRQSEPEADLRVGSRGDRRSAVRASSYPSDAQRELFAQPSVMEFLATPLIPAILGHWFGSTYVTCPDQDRPRNRWRTAASGARPPPRASLNRQRHRLFILLPGDPAEWPCRSGTGVRTTPGRSRIASSSLPVRSGRRSRRSWRRGPCSADRACWFSPSRPRAAPGPPLHQLAGLVTMLPLSCVQSRHGSRSDAVRPHAQVPMCSA